MPQDHPTSQASQTGPPPSREPNSGQTKRGIVFYLRLCFLGLGGLAIISILLSLAAFSNTSEQLKKTNQNIIPALEQAHNLMELVMSMDREARNLPNQIHSYAISGTVYRLNILSSKLKSSLALLDPAVVGAEELKGATASIKVMQRELENLETQVEIRAEARQRSDELLVSLNQMYAEIKEMQNIFARQGREVSPQWTGVVFKMLDITELLIAALATQDPARFVLNKVDFPLRRAQLQQNLPADSPELKKRALLILEKMDSLQGLFNERFFQLKQDVRIRYALRGLAVIDRLVKQMDVISTRLGQEAARQAAQTTNMISRLGWVLVGLSIACVLGLVLIMFFINRRIVVRMRTLRVGMLSHVSGKPQDIPLEGGDEISDMARSFMFYVDKVSRREKSLQERTRELDETLTELTESESRFQALVSSVPGCLEQLRVLPDNEWEYMYISPKAIDFYGEPAEKVAEKRLRIPWHPDDEARINQELQEALWAKQGFNLVGRTIDKSGDIRWTRINSTPVISDAGDLIYNGFVLDVTDRKMAEEEYLAKERLIKAMSQAVDDAMVMIDGGGRVMFWNPAAEKLFGYSAEEAMGMKFHKMAAPERYHAKVSEGLAVFARTGQGPVLGQTTEIIGCNREGREFPVEVTLSALEMDGKWHAVGTVRDITQRKRAQDQLKESEQRVQTILDSISTGIIIIDPETHTIFDVNPLAARIIGLEREKIIGAKCHQFICPKAENDCPITDHNQTMDNAERVLLTAQGEEIPVLKTVVPVTLHHKKYLLESFVDISDRKKAEEEMHNARNRLTQIFDFLPDATMVIDNQGCIIAWSRAMEEMTGIKADEMMGKGEFEYGAVFYGEARPILIDLVRTWDDSYSDKYLNIEKLEGGVLYAESFHSHLKGGIYISATARQLFDAEGQPNGAIETIRDITKLKEAEEAIKESEEKSRLILNSAGEGIFGVDKQGRVSFINPSALAMLGYSEDEIMGQKVHALIHHSRSDGSHYPVQECPMFAAYAKSENNFVGDEVLWRKGGQAFSVEYTSKPIIKDDQVVGAVVSFRDITERKEAEEEAKKYLEDLERFNRLVVGREMQMIELKKEINDMLQEGGGRQKYKIVD